MNVSTTSTLAERQATENLVKRLQAEGWTVVVQPDSAHLPEALTPFRPELVAHRGDEHLIVEIKSRRTPPDLDTVTLAERVAGLPGWRLDLVYVPDEPEAADREQLLRWTGTAEALAASAPEAALLLAWAAVEGLMHKLAEARGVDSEQPGRLLATLASLGVVDHDEHESLRRAMQTRNALAHGRRSAGVDSVAVEHLTDLARTLAGRARADAVE